MKQLTFTPSQPYQAQLEDTCPCCGQPLFLHGVQEYPAKYNSPSGNLIHCLNPDCPMDKATSTNILAAWEQRGKPRLQSA